MKRIEIEYFPDGTSKVEVFGAEGQECLKLTKEIEARHGVVKQITHKPEFYENGELVDTSKLCG